MASKSFIVLGLLLAALLVVSAREMTEQPKEEPTKTTPVEESQEVGTSAYGGGYGHGGGGYGGGYGHGGGGYGGGGYGGGYGHGGGGYGGGHGGYCSHRCCGYHGCHCCSKAEYEAMAQTQN